MVSNNIFRFAIIVSAGQAHSFNTNLQKLIKLVLYDNNDTGLNLSQIKKELFSQYSLEFAETELLHAISGNEEIVSTSDDQTIEQKYKLTLIEFKKIQQKQKVCIDDFVYKFLESDASEDTWEFEHVKELIYKFLYSSFDSDTQTVLNLLNRPKNITNENQINNIFDADDARIINTFLNWDDEPKNEFVLNLISSCFDYCMLTVKKDASSYADIFNGKEFYLDANIIFRMAGFDGLDQKLSIDAFISKCKNAGIKLCYTNHTYDEIKNTIKYYVDILKGIIGKKEPLSKEVMNLLSSKYSNINFLNQYIDWCNKRENIHGDYVSFRQYLEKVVMELLAPLKLIATTNYDSFKHRKQFNELCDDFTDYKSSNRKKPNESAVKVDINNYMCMLEKNPDNSATNFMQLKYYFISADRCFTEWTVKQRLGLIPMFVLPSVWYSILLKYRGRTAEDYAAFCQFLNIPISQGQDPLETEKTQMLSYVLSINEPHDIKERIVYDISSRLCNADVEIEDPIAFAQESYNSIVQTKVQEALLVANEKHEKQMIDARQASEGAYKQALHELANDNEVKLQKAKNESYNSGQDDIINKLAIQNVRKNKCILCIAIAIIFLSVLSFLALFLINTFFENATWTANFIKWYKENETAIEIVLIVCPILGGLFLAFVKFSGWFPLDVEKAKIKLNDRFNKK